MRFFLLLCVVLFIVGCSENVRFDEIDLAAAQEKARQHGKKVLIDFWADG